MHDILVVHLVTDLRQKAGGIAAVVPALAGALRDQGIENRFVTCMQDPDFEWRDSTTCVPLGWATNRAALSNLIRRALQDIPRGYQIVLHSHGLWHMLNNAGARLASREGLASLVSIHGMLLPWARSHKKLRKDIAWLLYQRRDLIRVDGVHVTSQAEADILAGVVLPERLHTIQFGVALPETTPPIPKDTSVKTLLFLGRLHPVKNLEALIRAFVRAGPDAYRLRLVGPEEDNYRTTLAALIDELGAGDRIEMSGPAYGVEKEREIASAHAVILPSFTENFGSVVAEALAMGRPVIASTGTPWQALETERCGWWVAPDIASLTQTIEALVKTPVAELAAMGARGRAHVTRDLSWNSTAKRMADLYTTLASSKAKVELNS